MARPKRDASEKRSAHLPPVRLTDAELASLADQAAAMRLTLSELVRQRLTTGKVTPRPTAGDASILVELNRCGVNLNQIARHANAGRYTPQIFGDTLAEFARVLELVGRAYGA